MGPLLAPSFGNARRLEKLRGPPEEVAPCVTLRTSQSGAPPFAADSRRGARHLGGMFIFFSNRLGCLGSVLVSLALSALLYLLFRAL